MKANNKNNKRICQPCDETWGGKRKDISIKSNVHLLQEELEENMKERKKNKPSIELHYHNGMKSPQLMSSKWPKRSQQLSSSKNGDFVHATKKQKQNHKYLKEDPPTKFVHHRDSLLVNHIEKFQKIVEYASHRLQEETLGLQEEPSAIKIEQNLIEISE